MYRFPKEVIERSKLDIRIVLEFLLDTPNGNCYTQRIEHVLAVRKFLIFLLGNDRFQELEKGFKAVEGFKKSDELREGECTMRDWIGEAWDKGVLEGMEKGLKRGIEKGKQEGLKQGKLEGLKQGMISTCRDLNITFEETAAKLKEKFSLEDAEVQKDMALYW